MSDWGLYEVEDALWSELGNTDDHIVPDQEDAKVDKCIIISKYNNEACGNLGPKCTSIKENSAEGKNVFESQRKAMAFSSPNRQSSNKILHAGLWANLESQNGPSAFNSGNTVSDIENCSEKTDNLGCYKDVKLESTDTENDLIGLNISKDDSILVNEESLLEVKVEAVDNDSCQFSLTDIYPHEEDLAIFGNENDERNNSSFVDYGWANIGSFEDVDRLLRNCESAFGHGSSNNVDELLWPSSGCIDNAEGACQHGHSPFSTGSKALNIKEQEDDSNLDFTSCDTILLSSNGCDSKNLPNEGLLNPEASCKLKSSEAFINTGEQKVTERKPLTNGLPSEGKGNMHGQPSNLEDTRIQKPERSGSSIKQIPSRKQAEGKSTKGFPDSRAGYMPSSNSYTSGSSLQQSNSSNIHTPASSALQVFPAPVHCLPKQIDDSSLRNVYPHVPYIHPGYGYPMHYIPILPTLPTYRPHSDQSQAVFPAYQHPNDPTVEQQTVRKPLESPLRPTTMTPQEKIEKLRWRQKMQARLAIEHQQQKLGGRSDSGEASLTNTVSQTTTSSVAVSPKQGNSRFLQSLSVESESQTRDISSAASTVAHVDDNGSMEGAVLCQLQNVISKLNIKTRMCIRDALYRLSKSAMQRRCLSEINSCEHGEQHQQTGLCACTRFDHAHPNRYLINEMETETNPIDRTIAFLLFNKCSVPSAESNVMHENSTGAIYSNGRSISTEHTHSSCRPGTSQHSLMVHSCSPVQSPSTRLEDANQCCPPNTSNIKEYSSGASCSSAVSHNKSNSSAPSVDAHKGLETLESSVQKLVKVESTEDMKADMLMNTGSIEKDTISSSKLASDNFSETGHLKKRKVG